MRNPWGNSSWTGPWSQNSPEWTPEIKLELSQRINQQSRSLDRDSIQGVFWIQFEDFLKFFSSVDICKLYANWFETRMSSYFYPQNSKSFVAYTLIVCETCEINISLYHKTAKDRIQCDLDMGFVVFKLNDHSASCFFSLGDVAMASKHTIRKFLSKEEVFEPGQYLIIPFSFNFWHMPQSSQDLYNLVIHTSRGVYLEEEEHNSELLADALIQLCIKKGKHESTGHQGTRIYYSTNDWFSGFIVVAENHNVENSNIHFQVQMDCQNSSNVVSTRRTLLTLDSVPPMHRQILLVLTQLESTCSYCIQIARSHRLTTNPYLNTWPGENRVTDNVKRAHKPALTQDVFALHTPRPIRH